MQFRKAEPIDRPTLIALMEEFGKYLEDVARVEVFAPNRDALAFNERLGYGFRVHDLVKEL